ALLHHQARVLAPTATKVAPQVVDRRGVANAKMACRASQFDRLVQRPTSGRSGPPRALPRTQTLAVPWARSRQITGEPNDPNGLRLQTSASPRIESYWISNRVTNLVTGQN